MPDAASPKITLTSAPNPRASILIASSSRTDLLLKCLSSLARNGSRDIAHEVVVVLNGTDPDLEHTLAGKVEGVTFIHSPVNLGFAGASNLARTRAKGEFLILLHDDTEIEGGWLEGLIHAAEREPHAGALGSKVLFPDGRLQHAGALLWRDGSTFLLSNAATNDDDLRRPVDYTGSASLLIRSAVWDAIGGLDEQFYPAYHIDVNLAMSVRAAGFYVSIEPSSVVRHHSSASSSKIARSFYGETNRKLFVEKWKQSLERYDSRPDPITREAIERARSRALLFSEQCRMRPLPLVSPRLGSFDRERQMLAHTIRRARLQESLADHLSRLIEANEAARHIFEAEAGAAIPDRSSHLCGLTPLLGLAC